MRDRARDQSQREQHDTSFSRVIVDSEGRTWIVREMPPGTYDRRGAPSLVFVTDDVMRRVRNYPADWHGRSDAELYEISFRR